MNSDVSFDLHCHPSSRDLNESLADGDYVDLVWKPCLSYLHYADEGGGIYRHTTMTIADPVSILPWVRRQHFPSLPWRTTIIC